MSKKLNCTGLACISLVLAACGGKDYGREPSDAYLNLKEDNLKECHSNGDYIYTPDDSAYLAGCQIVTGLVYIQPHGSNVTLQDYHLDELVHIEGALHIADSTSLEDVEGLNKLQSVSDQILILYNAALQNIDALANLESTHTLLINSNPVLTSISLDGLKSIDGEAQIGDNDILQRIEFAGLESVGNFNISSNSELTSVDFPSLTYAKAVGVWNPLMNEEDYAQLTAFLE